MTINYEKCNYSKGNKHQFCKHPYYCIFNNNRIQLEKRILNLQQKIQKTEQNIQFIEYEGTTNSEGDYHDLKEDLKIYNNDYKKLEDFENKIKKGMVKRYGFKQ